MATSSCDSLDELRDKLRGFARDRDWDQFHSPKNLAMALAGEAGEILELLQWKSEAESMALSEGDRARLAEELGDVLNYLVRLSDRAGIDLVAAAHRKIEINAGKYPIEKSRGNSRKYTDL